MNRLSPRRERGALVWDAPVRVFHWLLVVSFFGAWLSAESERWRLLHVTLGYTVAALIAFRVVWGFVGTRHARFADFVRGPRAALRYLGSLLGGRAPSYAGHNPAGGLAIVALLALGAGVAATGWAAYADLGGEWLAESHEALASTMLALVGVHVAAVLASSWLHGENLVAAMWTGRKSGDAAQGIAAAWRGVAALMLAAVMAFWWSQWRAAPTGPADGRHVAIEQHAGDGAAAPARRGHHDRRDRRDDDD